MRSRIITRVIRTLRPTTLAGRVAAAVVFAGLMATACDVHTPMGPGALATITISPNATLTINGTHQFTAVGTDSHGDVVAIVPTWTVVGGGGTIGGNGLFTAGTVPGVFTETIEVNSGGKTGNATVTIMVGPLATLIVVLPNPDTLAIGATNQFVALGRDAGGNVVAIAPVWSATAGGTITTGGLFTAGTVSGTFANNVQVTSGTIGGTATVTVLPGPVATIAVVRNPDTLASSATKTFSTVARDVNGNLVAIQPVWSVVAGGGTVGLTGQFTAGTLAGTYVNTLRAAVGLIAGTATVTVIPGPLASITVTPNPDSLAIGATRQFVATGRDAGGNVVPITPVWLVIAGGTLNATGLFTAGTVAGLFANTIVAAQGAFAGTATVVVRPGALATIAVTPTPASLAVGATQQFTAVGRDVFNNVVAITPAWSVVAGGGTISTGGLFLTAGLPATYTNTVQALSGAITGFATVIIVPPFSEFQFARARQTGIAVTQQ